PAGNPDLVPGQKPDTEPFDFTGDPTFALYPTNMLLPRQLVLQMGGFDERVTLRLAAEDNDFSYRWLSSGKTLRYEPDRVVCHHEWRTPREVEQLYVRYARGQGALYAK